MQLKKAIAAGALGALMAGSTLAFAASLSEFPAPFVQNGQANFLVVVGANAQPSDVVGAIDIAARLGGEPVSETTTTCPGSTAGTAVSGEGKVMSTTSTKVFLDDSLGKSGLRTTMTKDDLPTVLAKGTLSDADAGTTHTYQQFIYLTPAGTPANYQLQFERPGSSSADDGTYSFGRFPTSPSAADYLYKTYVTFDTAVNGTTAVGEKLTLFGNEYTVSSGTSSTFTGVAGDQLVLFGGALTQVLYGSGSATATLGGSSYTVKLVGVDSSNRASVQVGNDIQVISAGSSKKVGGLDIYVDQATQLSSNDQTQNWAKLLLGASKLTLANGAKMKTGDNLDTVDGTYVVLGNNGANKLSTITVYAGAGSSSADFLKLGGTYADPAWKTFALSFPSVSPGLAEGNLLDVKASGDNQMQFAWTDANGNAATVNFGYKALSSASQFSLGDSGGDAIIVAEGQTVVRDQYVVLDSGDFTHLYEATGVDLTPGSSSAYIDLRDVFTGSTTRVTVGADSVESAVIDGQTYNFVNVSTTSFNVTWGTGSSTSSYGTHITVFPTLKGKNGEYLALTQNATAVPAITAKNYTLPTGVVTWTAGAVADVLAAGNKEDGTTSSVSNVTNTLNATTGSGSALVYVGKTSTGGLYYNVSSSAIGTLKFAVVGSTATAPVTQPALVLVEEKDDASNAYAIVEAITTETSGSNYQASAAAPDFSATEDSQVRGSNSNIYDYVDLYGAYAVRDTSSQDNVKIYYPDEQRVANLYVLKSGATISTSGAVAGQTVTSKTVNAIKTMVGKLDTEFMSLSVAEQQAKNVISVGGPCVNKVTAQLLGKTYPACGASSGMTANTALVKLVENAFGGSKVALIVAGWEASNTRTATSALQTFETAGLTGTEKLL